MKATKDLAEHTQNTTLASGRAVFRQYYYLTKPGIIRGNLFAASAGFFLAASGVINIWHLVSMLAGLALVIASGCVCNNYIDRSIDARMARTSRRALVTGSIEKDQALVFAATLGLLGTAILAIGNNLLTAGLAVFGFIAYVVIYGIAKRTTVHGTVIGSISGAIPPVVGYAAVGHGLDLGAALIFIVLVCWQMPHFYAIALYRFEDYKSAKLPVLPAVRGFAATRTQITLYTIIFTISVASMTYFGVTSIWFGVTMTALASFWLLQTLTGLQPMSSDATAHWARRIFRTSLLVLTTFSVGLIIDSFM